MEIAILGTGNVGQTFAEKLISSGHKVNMGTRNVSITMERKNTDNAGSLSFKEWYAKNEKVQLLTFKDAVNQGEFIINALQGAHVLSVIRSCNPTDFDNKIIMDVSNPLDFSRGFPPSLLDRLNNTNSLGEEIQKALPKAKIIKTLNTMWCGLMVNPTMIHNGDHQNYICGNDKEAKEKVIELLLSFGWTKNNILDLGDITNARGTESTLLIWTRIYGATQNGVFNMKIMR